MNVFQMISENYMTFLWLIILVASLFVEIVTVGLTSIWAAGGALVAVILSLLGVPIRLQILAFLLVTAGLLYFTRPLAMQYFNNGQRTKTNYEGIIGKTIRIKETVDNLEQTGVAVVNGTEWTVRSSKENVILEEGSLAKVVHITGVKLIVEPYKEEE